MNHLTIPLAIAARLWRSLQVLWVALALTGAGIGRSSAAPQEMVATLESLEQIGGEYVVGSHPDLAALRVRVRTVFERTDTAGSSDTVTRTFRHEVRLIDEMGARVPLRRTGGLGADSVSFDPFVISLAPSRKATPEVTFEVFPAGATPLDPYRTYHFEVAVRRLEASGWEDATLPQSTASQHLYHFPTSGLGDTSYNVIPEVLSINWTRRHVVTSGTGSHPWLEAEVTYRVHRCDGCGVDGVEPVASDTIPLRFDFGVATGSRTVPATVEDGGRSSLVTFRFQEGIPRRPWVSAVQTRRFQFRPDAQLRSVTDAHRAVVTIAHQSEQFREIFQAGNTLRSAPDRVLHFNGGLSFGDLRTRLLGYANDPTLAPVVRPGAVRLTLDGVIAKHSDRITRDLVPAGPLTVDLLDSGEARVVSGTASLVGPPESTERERIGFRLPEHIAVDASGARAPVVLRLPPGLGYEGVVGRPLRTRLTNDEVRLDGRLLPTGVARFGLPAGTRLSVENRPLLYRSGALDWDTEPGELRFTAERVEYVRRASLEQLRAAADLPETMRSKPSNDGYWEFAQSAPGEASVVRLRVDTAGRMTTSATILFEPGRFTSHYPLGVGLDWVEGRIVLTEDLPDASASRLEKPEPVEVKYEQGCPEGGCDGREGALEARLPYLRFTPDGGLVGTGSAGSDGAAEARLRWGYNASTATHAHQAGPFSLAEYAMAGHWLAGGIASAEKAAGVLLHSGVRLADDAGSSATVEMIRPETPGYQEGVGAYPGINLTRSREAGAPQGAARLGGSPEVGFPLSPRSKYYARLSGVTGLHEAPAGQGPREIRMYDYPFLLQSFALSFQSGDNTGSGTRARLEFPFLPLETVFPMEELTFTCVGAPAGARIADAAQRRTFSHWSVDVEIPTVSFPPQLEASQCDPSARRFLALATQVGLGALDRPLAGTLYVSAAGQLLNPASPEKPESASFHLSAPAGAALYGEKVGEDENALYNFVLGKAHFSAFDGSRQGWVILYGGMHLPFYGSTPVEVMSAGTLAGTAGAGPSTFYVNGGWQDGLRWSGDPESDPAHLGRPGRFACPECDTWEGFQESPNFPVRIRADFADVMNLDFDLKWSPEAREFRGVQREETPLFVLSTERNLNRISARDLSVEFGLGYDGIPKIHLTQRRFELAPSNDPPKFLGTTAENLADFLGEELGASLNEEARSGFRSLRDIAGNSVGRELADTATEIAQGLSVRLREELRAACGDSDSGCSASAIEGALSSAFAATASPRLRGLIGTPSLPGPYLARRQHLLTRAYDSLASLSGRGGVLEPAAEGVVSRLEQVLVRMGEEAISWSPEFGASAVGLLHGAIRSSLQLAQPSVRRTTNAIHQAAQRIDALRARHGDGGDLWLELARLTSQANAPGGEFETLLDGVRRDLAARLAGPRGYAENGTPEQLRSFLSGTISDRLQRSDFARGLRQAGLVHIRLVQDDGLLAVHSLEVLLEDVLGEAFRRVLAKADALVYSSLLQDFDNFLGFASVRGYLDVSGDTITMVKLDADMAYSAGREFRYGGGGSVTYRALDSTGERFCTGGAGAGAGPTPSLSEIVVEFHERTSRRWNQVVRPDGDYDNLDPYGEVRAPEEVHRTSNFEAFLKVNLEEGSVVGLGGGFTLQRENRVAAVSELRISGSCVYGVHEKYLSGAGRMKFGVSGVEGDGGLFLGQSCDLAPILRADPDAAIALGGGTGHPLSDRPFTGFYVYAHAWIPIYSAGCVVSISGGVGLGAYADFESNRYGGKLNVGLRGELACVLSVTGELILFGLVEDGDLVFDGIGRIQARVGYCPFCVEFGRDFGLTHRTANSEWSVRLNP